MPASVVKPQVIKFILMAADMRRAVAFYTGVFGLAERHVSEWWSELAQGETVIALHGGHDGSRHPTGLSLQFESVIDAARRIEKAGGRILTFPTIRPGEPLLLGQVRDPEGNEFFITEWLGSST
jgi:predicted enzyme related to lactoylglutathione lyase